MTARTHHALRCRLAIVAGLAPAQPRRLRAPGAGHRRRTAGTRPGTGATDERAAGGGHRRECDHHRDARRGPPVRAPRSTVSETGEYTMRRPDRFHAKMTGGRGLESWYNGKMLTIAAHQRQGLRAGADARDHRPHAGRAGRALRHGAADGRSVLRPRGKGAALRHDHRRLRRHRERGRHALLPPGLSGRRRGLGTVAPGARASRCRSDSRSCRSGARASRWST